ncbi:hypothetical protein AAEX28_04715 [Lentisphaerota bacterium WC36G]|nr:hypothetical protein LJT99_07575 [Lentisphaerae bacterium WC36]
MGNAYHRQNSFTGGMITSSMLARNDIAKYASGGKNLDNIIVEVHGSASKRFGFKIIQELNPSKTHRLMSFVYATGDSYLLAFSAGSNGCDFKAFRDDMLVYSKDYFLPYKDIELYKINVTQSNDVLFMVHHNHAPRELVRLAHDNWETKTIDFEPKIDPPATINASPSGHSGGKSLKVKYAVSAIDAAGVESLPIKTNYVNIRDPWVQGAKVTISWEAVADADRYNIYKDTRGYFGFIGNVDKETLSFTDDHIEEASDDSPKSLDVPFKESCYPATIGIHQQRMTFANTQEDGQNIFLTASGTFSDFTVSSPSKDDDSIEFKVDSRQGNEVKYILPLENMVVLTSGTEIMVTGNQGNVLTPTAINAKIQSYWGCHDVPPIICGKSILFVGRYGKKVRDLMYALANDGYNGGDLSVLASDLFDSPIKDWCYCQQPNSIIWVMLENGKLLSLTYLKEHEVFAWCQHTVKGEIKSLAAVPNLEYEDLYILIEYQGKLLLERMGRDYENIYLDHATLLEDTNSLESSPLIGKLAVVDNKQFVDEIDKNETLDNNVTGYCGVKYTAIIETLNPSLSDNGQEAILRKRLSKVAIKLQNSCCLKVQSNTSEVNDVLMPTADDNYTLYSQTENVDFLGTMSDEATVKIFSDLPYPFKILSITKEIEIGQ